MLAVHSQVARRERVLSLAEAVGMVLAEEARAIEFLILVQKCPPRVYIGAP